MRLTEYQTIPSLSPEDIFIMNTENGTKTILAADIAKTLLGLAPSDDILSNIDLSELNTAAKLKTDDVLLIGTAENGNEKVKVEDAFYKLLDPIAKIAVRRNIYRGKNLGSVVTDEQWNEIGAGTFRGMFVGDYWEIGGRKWRIVDIDYWLNTGDTPCTTHHLVIMPDSGLYAAKMNDTNTTVGGYVGSKMVTENLSQALDIVSGAFGYDHLLVLREILTNAVTDGRPSGGSWYNTPIVLPNEPMMYGSYIMAPAGNGTTIPYRYTIDKTQLAIMQLNPYYINPDRQNQWLRDVVSGTYFAYVDNSGAANSNAASVALVVRPVFGIRKADAT